MAKREGFMGVAEVLKGPKEEECVTLTTLLVVSISLTVCSFLAGFGLQGLLGREKIKTAARSGEPVMLDSEHRAYYVVRLGPDYKRSR